MSVIFFLMSIGLMSHVDLKKGLCQDVDFKGQGPYGFILPLHELIQHGGGGGIGVPMSHVDYKKW